jgi:hypothetical protein
MPVRSTKLLASDDQFMTGPSYSRGIAGAILTTIVIASCMIMFEYSVGTISAGRYLDDGKLTDTSKASLQVMLDLLKLLMNWAILIIGASSFFLKINIEKNVSLRPFDVILSFCVILLAVISLFFGHLMMDKTAEILSLDLDPTKSELIRRIGRFQYISGLGAIALFGFHVFQFFWARLPDRLAETQEDRSG